MNRRGLFILAAVFAALVIFALIQNPAPPTLETPAPVQRVFPNIGLADIQAVRLRAPDGSRTLTISRADDGYWTTLDQEGQIDQTAADNIAKTLVLLPYRRTLPLTASTRLVEFGLQPAKSLAIEVLLHDGQGHAVLVGDLSGTLTTYYALVDDRAEIILIERPAIDFLLTQLRATPLT